jgi:hypothetical protein
VRELAPFALLVCACGAAVRQSPPELPSSASSTPAAGTAPSGGEGDFDALAALGPSLAPGMREVARKETGTDVVELARADGRDACVRVAFEASAPVTVKLVDQAGNVLAATDGAVTEGVLAARGPLCVRKGDAVRGMAEGAGARLRWMVWEGR